MANNGKDTKYTRQISRIMHLVTNVEECSMNKKVWCEGGLQLADNETNNFGEDKFNPRLRYDTVRFENLLKTCTRGMIRSRRIEEQCVINYSTGLIRGFDAISLKCSY